MTLCLLVDIQYLTNSETDHICCSLTTWIKDDHLPSGELSRRGLVNLTNSPLLRVMSVIHNLLSVRMFKTAALLLTQMKKIQQASFLLQLSLQIHPPVNIVHIS